MVGDPRDRIGETSSEVSVTFVRWEPETPMTPAMTLVFAFSMSPDAFAAADGLGRDSDKPRR